jgi:DNA-3-methyladenine glycosylase I
LAFHSFDIGRVARYTQEDTARLLADPGIVRNRLKIEAAVRNARGALAIADEFGSLDAFLWRHVDGAPKRNAWKCLSDVPAKTRESDLMSKDFKKRGFNFVGSTICYSLMQAVGMVNDHTTDCFRYRELAG